MLFPRTLSEWIEKSDLIFAAGHLRECAERALY